MDWVSNIFLFPKRNIKSQRTKRKSVVLCHYPCLEHTYNVWKYQSHLKPMTMNTAHYYEWWSGDAEGSWDSDAIVEPQQLSYIVTLWTFHLVREINPLVLIPFFLCFLLHELKATLTPKGIMSLHALGLLTDIPICMHVPLSLTSPDWNTVSSMIQATHWNSL